MTSSPRSFLLATALVGLGFAGLVRADGLFYREVERGGRLHVFARAEAYEDWSAADTLASPIVREAYGPKGETVVFDGEEAVAFYEARHAAAAGAAGEAPPAPAPTETKSSGVFKGWHDGKTVFESDSALLELSNRVQFRWTNEMPDSQVKLPGTENAGDSRGSFRIRRAKTKLEGWFWKKELTYELQLSWAGPEPGASTDTPLENIFLTWDASKHKTFSITIGQFKVPLGRQEMTSSQNLQFCDRDILSGEFTRGRDVGVQVEGVVAKGKIEYMAGIFNGDPASHITNDNAKYQYNARVVLRPWGDVKYSEGDFESKDKPLLAVGAEFENNNLYFATNATNFDTTILGADLVFKYKGFSLFGEYFARQRKPQTGSSFHSNGYHVQSGYFLQRDKLEVAFRYAAFDPSDAIPGNQRKEIGGAFSYFVNKHLLKIQADFRQIEDESRNIKNKELRVQTQFVF